MYVARIVLFFLLTTVIYSCSNQDGNAPTKFTNEEGSTLPSSAVIYGSVKDSLTSFALDGVTVTVYQGATPVSATTTDSSGQYAFSEFANGAYTMNFAKSGYISISNSAVSVAGVSLNINKSMTPPTQLGQIRIVMSWYGENENVPNISPDLDAYLLNTSENTFTNFEFTTQSWADGSDAALDADSTNYLGPETITLSNVSSSSNYRFYVHNYSNYQDCASLSVSGVHVDVYSGGSLLKSYDIPASGGGGAIYEFFSIENGQIVDKNRYDETIPITDSATISQCIP
ncbi:MAG: hypothetical protein K0R29_2341 [Pseudobdellovibrio sp.]|nr:hypothetical protein [Pseudobdellovibrio sp.]